MTKDVIKIVFKGKLRDGFEQEQVIAELARLFKAPEEMLRPYFNGRNVVLKDSLDAAQADKYLEKLYSIGLVCEAEPPLGNISTPSAEGEVEAVSQNLSEPVPQEAADDKAPGIVDDHSSKFNRVALPAYLRKRLQAFRVLTNNEQGYQVKDRLTNRAYHFEPWQFFVLEVLPGCEDFEKLASVFADRYGHPISEQEVNELFASVAANDLLGYQARSHPLLRSFCVGEQALMSKTANDKHKDVVLSDVKSSHEVSLSQADSMPKKDEAGTKASSGKESGKIATANDEELPAGARGVAGFDPTVKKRGVKLLDPRPLLKIFQPLLLWLKYSVYVLPLLLITAVSIVVRYHVEVEQDISRLLGHINFLEHAVLSMFTVNLLATMATALVGYTYRATVSAISIVFYFGVFPRFMAQVGHARQLSRRERMWLHATPLLLRLGLFSLGIFLWFGSRDMNNILPQFGLSLAVICLVAFFFTANPLVKSSGYHLLSAFLNEPFLRGKSYKAFFNKVKGNVFSEVDSNKLAAYALASFLYSFIVVVVIVLIAGYWLKLRFSGVGLIIAGLIGIFLLRRLVLKMRRIEQAYERSVQFERWRKRALPAAEVETETKKETNGVMSYLKKAVGLVFVALMFVPYTYEPSGKFEILADTQQVISTDVSGIVGEVFYDGGEILKKGTVIATLVHDDYEAQVKVLTARVQEQQAVIDELRSRPKPEAVALANRELEVDLTRAEFSKSNLERVQKLYNDGGVSFEEFDKARREHEVDLRQVEQGRAKLELVKSGATPEELAAAEAKLQSYVEELSSYKDKIKRTTLYMPFDGRLSTMHLKHKIGSYLERGKPFAAAEKTSKVIAQIEISEDDIQYVSESARVWIQPKSYPDELFSGVVTQIDTNVTEKPFGNVVRVVTELNNNDGRLRKGMTGYAKVKGTKLPVWKVFGQDFIRFFEVEVWSWTP